MRNNGGCERGKRKDVKRGGGEVKREEVGSEKGKIGSERMVWGNNRLRVNQYRGLHRIR